MAGMLTGKVALVTGGGSGIGRATAAMYAREGAKVVVADLNESGGRQTTQAITDSGGEATYVQVNVTQAEEVDAMVAIAVARYGRLDSAFNGAGVASVGPAGERHLTADYPDDMWQQIIDVNLTGVWLCMKYELRQMLRNDGGTIVNAASVAGLTGLPTASAYVASKHGVIGLTKTAALEYAKKGIRVNCVCPGYIETPMTAPGRSDPESLARMVASKPLGRLGQPEEVAESIVWLSSESTSFVTGHTMTIDGGYSAK
jgi:NAD(P)-dependent dehydrogenase (short-subunit alcohol dehydrogenase family)